MTELETKRKKFLENVDDITIIELLLEQINLLDILCSGVTDSKEIGDFRDVRTEAMLRVIENVP